MAFENLSIKLSADTAGFTAPIEAARSRTEELADGLGQLTRRASRADDAIEEAGDSATQTTSRFAILSAGTQGLNLSMGVLTSSVVTITAAFTALLAVLTPAVAALGAFAAIAGGIGLVGLSGALLGVTQHTERLKGEALILKDALLNEFAPAGRAAQQVLSSLIAEAVKIVPQLGPASGEINTIATNFDELGTNVIQAIPPLVDAATQLTTQFLPGVADASGGLEGFAKNIRDLVTSDRFKTFIDNAIASAKELAPEISQIVENLGGLTDETTLKGLTTLVDGFLDLLVVITGILDKLDPLFAGISKISSTFGGVGQSSLGAAGDADSGNVGGLVPQTAPAGSQNPYSNAGSATNATTTDNPMQVNVAVEGDTGVIETVSAEVADQKIQEQADNAMMNAGTGGP